MIKKEPLEKVASGGNFKVNNTLDDKEIPLPAKTIVLNADTRIGEKVNYRPLANNCE